VIASVQQAPSSSDLTFNKNVTPAFDMILVNSSDGNFRLIIFMRIKMNFIREAESTEWTIFEKSNFEKKFNTVINDKWASSLAIMTLTKNKRAYLDFRFSFTNMSSAFPPSHWSITVRKIPKRYEGYQSLVTPSRRTAELDNQDFDLERKIRGTYQRGVVHEFGHLLGYDDEYRAGSKYYTDVNSIMNAGETIRQRHRSHYMTWLSMTLKAKKIN